MLTLVVFAPGHRALVIIPTIENEPGVRVHAIDDEMDVRVMPVRVANIQSRMVIIETFARGCEPKHRPTPTPAAIRIDTS